MYSLSAVLIFCLAAHSSFTAATKFDYATQQNWTGQCAMGNQQSPIDITTSNVRVDSSLSDLQFNAWDASYNGTFINVDEKFRVHFVPSTLGAATTINHLGTYSLQQLHFHWGGRTGEGSEHKIDGDQAELEIHFVHFKQGVTDPAERGDIAVVAVLGDIDERAITGPWAKLDVTQIQSNSSSSTSVTDLILDLLLPNNKEYYYYQGSLTVPPCTEIVDWFVLKDRITVPGIYLEKLRRVQKPNGEMIEFNFRDTQMLGDRMVMTASQAINKPFIALLMLSLLFIAI